MMDPQIIITTLQFPAALIFSVSLSSWWFYGRLSSAPFPAAVGSCFYWISFTNTQQDTSQLPTGRKIVKILDSHFADLIFLISFLKESLTELKKREYTVEIH